MTASLVVTEIAVATHRGGGLVRTHEGTAAAVASAIRVAVHRSASEVIPAHAAPATGIAGVTVSALGFIGRHAASFAAVAVAVAASVTTSLIRSVSLPAVAVFVGVPVPPPRNSSGAIPRRWRP